jgi:hypothetical protein
MTMAVVNIGHYYAEWMPSGSPDKAGRGRIILRSATRLTELFRLTNLGSEDYRNLLHMLQTEKPVFWDSEAGWLRTAHPQMHDAPVGEQEGMWSAPPLAAAPGFQVTATRKFTSPGFQELIDLTTWRVTQKRLVGSRHSGVRAAGWGYAVNTW